MEVITASCPKCSAQYQLTPEQLAVANGQVRCGACMTVFQAVPPSPQAATPPPAPKKPDKPSKSSFINNEDDLLLNDTGVRESFDDTSDFETGEFSATFDDLAEIGGLGEDNTSLDDDATFGDNSTFDDDATFDDDSSFDDNSSFDSSFEESSLLDDNFSDEFNSGDDTFGEEILLSGEGDLISEDDIDSADESWAEQLLDDDDNEEEADADLTMARGKAPEETSSDQPRAAMGALGDDFDFDADLEGMELGSLSKGEEEDLGFSDKDEMIDRITPEPLEFHLFQANSLISKIVYGAISFFTILLFTIQLFYFQFETMSRDPDWRSLYETSCGIFGCELPEQYSINDISAKHLTIKSHPYYKQTLIVDTIITNHADILQPFPKLELFFTNNSQEIVSARQFNPEEYLRGELADASIMPSRQSVHVALEINDPGTKATGYWIQLTY